MNGKIIQRQKARKYRTEESLIKTSFALLKITS